MKTAHTLSIALIAALGGATATWLLVAPDHDMEPPPEAAAPQTTAATTEHRATAEPEVLYWYDPMKPEVHFDKPGKSPFMDMQLVPKYAEAVGETGTVSVSPDMVQSLGIRTAAVEGGVFWQRVDTVGAVDINPHLIRVVESRAKGWIESQTVHNVGETVHAGQEVAGIYSPELYAAQEELLLARRSGDTELIAAARQRLELLGAADSQIDSILRRGRADRQIELYAPIDGVVLDIGAHEGKQIGPGMPLMRIADLSQVWIIAEVPESQATWIAPGRAAEARFAALPGEVFEGTVDYTYPTLDATTRTMSVRLVFDNSNGRLKPGMYADVSLYGGGRREAVLVPSEALIRTGTRTVVIVAGDDNRFRPVQVEAGPERDNRTVILAGLHPGQHVVVSGQFLIDSEASLRGAFNRMTAAAGKPHDATHPQDDATPGMQHEGQQP